MVLAYASFGKKRGWLGPIFPATSPRVEAWIAHEAYQLATAKGLSKKSLKRKLSALASWHTDLGMPKDGIVNERVERVIAGANRFHGMTSKPQPLPITLPVLRALAGAIRRHPSAFGGPASSAALVACFTLAFACFMRMGELTYNTFDPRFDLRRDSIARDGEWKITIPASKADAFRQGVTVVIPEGHDDVCPRKALQHWFDVCPEAGHAPLFSLARGPFTRARVVAYLNRALTNCGYASAQFSGHSFRRGAATWASSIGMSATDIKTLGRWNSECYRLYIDAGPQRSANIGRNLLTTPVSRSSLPASGIPEPGNVWRPSLV